MKKALIIDGNNLLFKAYYATAYQGANLHSLQGIPTNALYAFIRMITKFLTTNKYDSVFVAFDAGKTTFRSKQLETYKANRSATPNELIMQFDLVKQFLDLAHIPWSQIENYEADDLIGTLAKGKNSQEYEIDIMSSDKDLYQLLDRNIKVLAPQKGMSDLKVIDEKVLHELYQITPNQIPDLKGLMGDSSDNLPGIKGIGPKTAIKLLQDYHSLENIIAHADETGKSNSTKIKENKELGLLTKELAKLNLESPLKRTLNECSYDLKLLENKSLQSFYKKYDMKSLITNNNQTLKVENSKIIILDQWLEKYNDKTNYLWTEVCWDNYHRDPISAMAISNSKGIFYLPIGIIKQSKAFQEFLTNDKYQKITWDIKKAIIAIKNNFDIMAQGFIFDHMLAAYLLYSNENINLEHIAELLAFNDTEHLSDDNFYGKGAKRALVTDEKKVAHFLELKLNFLMSSYQTLLKKLESNNNLKLYQEIELPTVYPLITMELNGIAVDKQQLETMAENTNIELKKLEAKINEIAQKEINPNSPKQISQYLFQELKLPDRKKGSTAFEVLVSLQDKHPIINILLEYRKLQKLYGTYLIGLQKFIFPDNKIHTCYNQVQASTGRISSIDPNMQNITVKDEGQREVRKVFIASNKNLKVLSCDYSQIELRILAHISGDENLINAFKNNHDIHKETASKVFNVPLDQVTKEQRNRAKAVNFGIVYGISAFGLSQQLKISISQAKEFIDKYFIVFPKIKTYINDMIAFCQTNGYVETIFHRKRAVPEINNKNAIIKEFGQRIAMNMPIQGSAADIIKLAMIKIDEAIKAKKIKAQLVAQVHDELIFEVLPEDIKTVMAKVTELMSDVVKLKVPLIVNGVSGNNWYDLK